MSREDLYQMVRDCEDRESRLTEWEVDFIAEMGDLLESGKDLSPGRQEKLEEIWESAVAEG